MLNMNFDKQVVISTHKEAWLPSPAKGSYLRNPNGFLHSLFSEEGCTLLVKVGHL